LRGVVARDVESKLADDSDKNTPPETYKTGNMFDTPDDDTLSDTERALIKLLRNNDVPPDLVAQSIREVLERRMGR
jgi:hypothetical protein